MRRVLLVVLALSLFASVSPAQQRFPKPTWGIPRQPEHTMNEMVAARDKLIRRYVLADPRVAWGVSVCGADDLLTDEPSDWLTIYVYSDQLNAFALDFDKFATRTGNGSLTVDGISVVVEVVKRPKQGAKNEPTIERNDRQLQPKNGRSNAVVSGKPSRA